MSAAIVAFGAASALGEGRAAFDVGSAGSAAPSAWSVRRGGKPFGRVGSCSAPRSGRPVALLETGFDQIVEQLARRQPDFRRQRLGVIVGTSSGGMPALELALSGGNDVAPWAESAYFAPLTRLKSWLGKEPERLVSLYAACASSALALGLGLRWLQLEQVDLVICGGYDAESDLVCAGFDALKATSSGLPRPFAAERDGMALGEGVALLALMRESREALGYLHGFAATTDAVHITAPDRTGKGLARAASSALDDAAVVPHDVDFVSVHGTGTSFNDAAEVAALSRVFGRALEGKPLHAFKTSIGHTLGAAAGLEVLAALSALEHGVIPASLSAGAPMPELSGRLLEVNQAARVEHCLKLSTAFGGANAALVLSRRPPPGASRRLPRPVHLCATSGPVFELDVSRVRDVLVAPLERLPRSDPLSSLAVMAGAEVLRAAKARGFELDRLRTAVVVGSVGATLELDVEFAARVLERGPEHAEPRRFPSTSPNAAAGHVAIAFGLGGLSHAVGSGPAAAAEAVEVARDWVLAGDADAVLVIAAEHAGATSRRVLAASGLTAPGSGASALLISTAALGPVLDSGLLEDLRAGRLATAASATAGFGGLLALGQAAGLPSSAPFGTVRRAE